VFRKRVLGVGSGNRKSSAANGSQSDWRHDQTSAEFMSAFSLLSAAVKDSCCLFGFYRRQPTAVVNTQLLY